MTPADTNRIRSVANLVQCYAQADRPNEEWFFRRAEGFYVIDIPIGSKPEEHARLNPGTLEIRRVMTGELLWGTAQN